MRPTWNQYALNLALAARSRSEDPYLKVGAVVLRADRSVAGVGYNGPPPGVNIDWTDRDQRRPLVLHAEENAFRYCRLEDTRGGLVATTHLPCTECIKLGAAYQVSEWTFTDADPMDPVRYPTLAAAELAEAFNITLTKEPHLE